MNKSKRNLCKDIYEIVSLTLRKRKEREMSLEVGLRRVLIRLAEEGFVKDE